MPQPTPRSNRPKTTFDAIETTSETLTARGGLVLFSRYLDRLDLFRHLERLFGSIRKSNKGLPVGALFKQLLCFFVDGTSYHLSSFDQLKQDAGYAAVIETAPDEMASSHTVKRFLKAFSWPRIWLFRHLLQRLFLWRLRRQRPSVIVLGLDTMVMDNDQAQRRHGVAPTYRGVRGFQPLQMSWQGFLIDAVFRGGRKHSNHGETVEQMVRHVVRRIRKHYRADCPIVLRLDSGFFDEKLFAVFEELHLGYVCGGRRYEDLKRRAEQAEPSAWGCYQKQDQRWHYLDFEDRRGCWGRPRRALYLRPEQPPEACADDRSARETVLYTNLGRGEPIDGMLQRAGQGHAVQAEQVIECYHGRGADELVHRALKDFGTEQLPFKRFAPNAAYYYLMLVAFFLYEAFKRDVTAPVVEPQAYATTLRRRLLDFAAKVVRTGGRLILKVTAPAMRALQLARLWRGSASVPRLDWA